MRITAWQTALAVSTVSHALILGFAPAGSSPSLPPAGQQAAEPMTLTVLRAAAIASPATQTPTRVLPPARRTLSIEQLLAEANESTAAELTTAMSQTDIDRAVDTITPQTSLTAPARHGPPTSARVLEPAALPSGGAVVDYLPARPAAGANAPPAYPLRARERGWEGTVVLAVDVDAMGNVTQVRIAESSGHRILDRAAQTAVAAWRFQPAHAGGVAFISTVRLPVIFRLEEH